jgi:hypothetical protein
MKRVVRSSCIVAMLTFGVVAYAQTTGQNPTGQAGSPTMTSDRPTSGDRTQTQQQMTLVGCIQRESEYRQAAGSGRGGTMGTGMGVGNEFVLVNASPGGASHTSMSESAGTSTAATSPAGTTATSPASTAPATTAGTASGTAGTTGTTASGTATAGTASATATGTTSASTPSASASSSTSMASGGKAYALTGNREKELEQYVGQRVEIVGTLERGGARSGGYGAGAGTGTGTAAGTGTGTAAGTATAPGTTPGTATGTTAGTGTMSGSAGASQRFSELQQINIVSFRAVGGSCTR